MPGDWQARVGSVYGKHCLTMPVRLGTFQLFTSQMHAFPPVFLATRATSRRVPWLTQWMLAGNGAGPEAASRPLRQEAAVGRAHQPLFLMHLRFFTSKAIDSCKFITSVILVGCKPPCPLLCANTAKP